MHKSLAGIMTDMDKYIKLKVPKPIPDSEICKCADRPPVVLQSHLTYNPISCADCNLEVSLNQLNFTTDLFDKIADWRNFHDSFYKLWLDSGEFEKWAKEHLSSANSPVNKRGLILRDKIAESIQCYFWWFADNSDSNVKPFTKCPNCSGHLIKRENKYNVDTNICGHCNIIIATNINNGF